MLKGKSSVKQGFFLYCAFGNIEYMNGLFVRIENLKKSLKIEDKIKRIVQIEQEMNSPEFWLDERESSAKSKELKKLQDETNSFSDIYELSQIAENEEDISALAQQVEEMERICRYSGKYDDHSAVINIYAGAGGDDAQDWSEMLMRMYLKWADSKGYSTNIVDLSKGGIAGIKSVTLEIIGNYIYGQLKNENGVHRLVRQSPFNAKNLRQTSFSLVEIMPLIESNKEIEIDDNDLKIDTFRSSGKGGQGVNTTDSAVRITHLPTGISASCQNERSQLQNRESAMKVLRSRLAKLLEEQRKEKISELRGESMEPEWGSQIRSYVLHPYKMVKDHRTNVGSKDPDKVLNGEIEEFIN